MPEQATNLASALRAPLTILAPATEFLTVGGDGTYSNMPTAHKMRMGTRWVGLNGTYGTITKVNLKPIGEMKGQPSGAPGKLRSKFITGPGFALSMTVHYDRGTPALRRLDRFSAWVDVGAATPEILFFHVEDLSEDMGDEDTVTLEITAEHRVGLDDLNDSNLIRAEVDEYGRVITSTPSPKFTASETSPFEGLPTNPEGAVDATWTRALAVITVTKTAHGLTSGDTIAIINTSDAAALPLGDEVVTVLTSSTFTVTGLSAGAAAGTLSYL